MSYYDFNVASVVSGPHSIQKRLDSLALLYLIWATETLPFLYRCISINHIASFRRYGGLKVEISLIRMYSTLI